jgi:hypothetical protein
LAPAARQRGKNQKSANAGNDLRVANVAISRLSTCQFSVFANVFSALRHAACVLEAIAGMQHKCTEIFAVAAEASRNVGASFS